MIDWVVAMGSIIFGFAILIKGADWLVEGGSSLARTFGMSELFIGLTIVSFGTSMPELTVNILSSFKGANDIAIGNIVGSNIANILLILGAAAAITSINVQTSTVWKEVPLSILAAVLLFIMANDILIDGLSASVLSRSDGLSLLAFFLIFLWYSFSMQKEELDEGEHQAPTKGILLSFALIAVGVILLVFGGGIAVDGAIFVASGFGVSQALIGLTIVAVGTSLPELATSVVAARKGKADIAVGNVVGSNIFNIFFILGTSALLRPLPFQSALNVDIFMIFIASIVLFFALHTGYVHRRIFFWKQKKGHVIERGEGVFMLLLYVAYIAYLAWRG